MFLIETTNFIPEHIFGNFQWHLPSKELCLILIFCNDLLVSNLTVNDLLIMVFIYYNLLEF